MMVKHFHGVPCGSKSTEEMLNGASLWDARTGNFLGVGHIESPTPLKQTKQWARVTCQNCLKMRRRLDIKQKMMRAVVSEFKHQGIVDLSEVIEWISVVVDECVTVAMSERKKI